MNEHAMNAAVVRALNAIPGCKAIKIGAGRYMRKGTPDIHATFNGRSFWLEGKRAGERPTPIQRAELLGWATAGAVAAVYRSAAEAVAIVKGEAPCSIE